MLLSGIHHIGTLTHNTERLHDFYGAVFDAEILRDGSEFPDGTGPRLSIIKLGPTAELNVFQIDGNWQADVQTPMFGRGRIDHLSLLAASHEAFDEIRSRLRALGAADDFVTDFGPTLSLFFRDPDGMEAEVCVANPDLVPGVVNPPGTRARRYPPES